VGGLWLPHIPVNELKGNTIECVRWSPFGRVVVGPFNGALLNWANTTTSFLPVEQKWLEIDYQTFSTMVGAHTSAPLLAPLKDDIAAAGMYLRQGKSAFIIGAGGGKEVLTALQYGFRKVDALEVNPSIVDLLKGRYADFTGYLYSKPGVSIINDEARSWLAGTNNKYDLIQSAMVASYSASMSGIFMLTENVIYTKEAFELYFSHLEPDGILSVARWGDRERPAQILRTLNIARAALAARGVSPSEFGRHVILLGATDRDRHDKIGELLLSLKPFSEADIAQARQFASRLGYEIEYLPDGERAQPFADFISGGSNVDAGLPTDDCPFFFTPARPGKSELELGLHPQAMGLVVLNFTLLFDLLLVVATILLPAVAMLKDRFQSKAQMLLPAWYFSCIGVAFMLVEVAQIERLTVLLGNPTYSLSVVLFSLLLAAGSGAATLNILLYLKIKTSHLFAAIVLASSILITVSALASAAAVDLLVQEPVSIRICIAAVLVFLPGFFMGWALPLGLTVFMRTSPTGGAWFWAVNGGASVLGSCIAAILSISQGITCTFLTGAVLYLLCLLPCVATVAKRDAMP
jgi:hypothetical protein